MKVRSHVVILTGILTVIFISFLLMLLHTTTHTIPPSSSLSSTSSSSSHTTQSSISSLFRPFHMETKEMLLASHAYNGIIYTDWIRDSFHFNYLNYKSLESLLVSYPQAEIEMTVIGPQAANYYKLGNLMRFPFLYSLQTLFTHPPYLPLPISLLLSLHISSLPLPTYLPIFSPSLLPSLPPSALSLGWI